MIRKMFPAVSINNVNNGPTDLNVLKPHRVVGLIEYIPKSVVVKIILNKLTGNITLYAFDAGETSVEKVLAFDTYVQIIEGKARLFINGKKYDLTLGEAMMIPAHARQHMTADVKFKMTSTTIKSGYED